MSRSKELIPPFVSHDVEQLLNSAKTKNPQVSEAVKAALRDLNLKVDLKEEWVKSEGSKVLLSNDTQLKDIPEDV